MEQFLAVISDIRVVIAIVIIVAILAIWLVSQKVKTKKYRAELEELEKKYNELKSVPVQMKVNKAAAIGRIDETTALKVDQAEGNFKDVQASIKHISDGLAEAEDNILMGKLKKASSQMDSIEKDIGVANTSVKNLDTLLDDILSKETAQRQQVTGLKNRFRALKSQAQENATKLSFVWPSLEQKIADTETMFSTFEEWMYSQDYEKANAELTEIKANLADIENTIATMPGLLEDARGIIPSMAETLHHDYSRNKNRGVYLAHLNVEKNLQVLTVSLRDDLKKLKAGNAQGVSEHIEDYKKRITQMDEAVKNEGSAYDQLRKLSRETEELFKEAQGHSEFIQSTYSASKVKYGLEGMSEKLESDQKELERLLDLKPHVYDNVRNYQIPATTVLVSLKELNADLNSVNDDLKEIRSKLEVASGDEDRAKKQLVKLQVIMNQMQVKVRKYKLPNISETYDEDMNKAQNYIDRLEAMLKEAPINMQAVTALLQEALDFIYKLYNNVNNVVGTVVMVENTIVFGNRYRSTYADIDSELTRSELSFRNGEYTQALSTAIATIEKIHPSNYESMIKENAKSVA